MAAARNDASLDSGPRSRRGGLNIQFVDEDELPLAHLTEHRVSEDEFFLADESGSSQEDSDEETMDEDSWMTMWKKMTALRISIEGKM